MTRTHVLFCILFWIPAQTWSQTGSVTGRTVDANTRSPLNGVHVRLTTLRDTTESVLETTDAYGRFIFTNLVYQSYRLEATLIGRLRITRTIRLEKPLVNLGEIPMTQSVITLGEVLVQVDLPPTVQRADTTEFNARAFKTNPDADAGDLLTKMPGITVDNSGVKAQGEDVQQILVDGKPFFGSDPTLAIRNLPADAIEKIQVFDKMSDQAEFTGFDDGQSVRTINIITRRERRNQGFGKVTGGYGNDTRYLTGGNLNVFHEDTRISVIGLSNNVNQQNFSMQDFLGVSGGPGARGGGFGGGGSLGRRGGGGGGGSGGFGGGGFGGGQSLASTFLVGQQSGITTTNSIGTNYSDTWGKDLKINASYFFNASRTNNDQRLNRQYFAASDSSSLYDEQIGSNSQNHNHRIDTRVEYALDSSNSIIVQPRVYFQSNASASLISATSLYPASQLLNAAANDNLTNTDGYNSSSHVILRHKFDLPGRTVSADLGATYNHKNGASDLQSLTEFSQGVLHQSDTLDQQSSLLTNSTSLSARLVYTEPLSLFSLMQLSYYPTWTRNTSDNRKYKFDPVTQQYTTLEENVSNTYANRYSTQHAGIGYRYRGAGVNAMVDVSYQIASLSGDQQYPFSNTVSRTFYNLLPSATMNLVLSDHTNLRMFYRTSTSPPSVTQLQNVVDNTNPLLLTAGNPNLNQTYNHNFVTRYSTTNADKSQSLLALFSAAYSRDYVGNSTITALRDTILSGGILMSRGMQLSYPVNLDGYWNLRSFLTYSLPFGFIQSNLNFTSGLTYSRTPALINGSRNISNSYALSGGVVVSSNVSEDVDFTLSYTGNYTISRYSLQPLSNSNYFYHTAGVKINLIFWEGIVLRNEINNTLYTGLTGTYNQNLVLWNVGIGKKFFAEDRGELRITGNDVLNQNKSVTRSFTDSYVEDSQTRVLARYFIVTFTYTFR